MKFFLALTILSTSLTATASVWDLVDLKNKMSSEQLSKMGLHPNEELLVKDKVLFENKLGVNSPIVYVAVLGPQDNFLLYCAGALTSSRAVLTSKHCLQKKDTKRIVVLTDSYFLGKVGAKDASHSYVSSVIEDCPESGWCKKSPNDLHIKFDPQSYDQDFARDDLVLLVLGTAIHSPDGYFELARDREDFEVQKLQIGGFPSFANEAAKTVFKYISEPICDFVGEFEKTYVTNCVPTNGLSGGPLFYKRNGRQYLVGIVSGSIGPLLNMTRTGLYSGARVSAPLHFKTVSEGISTR